MGKIEIFGKWNWRAARPNRFINGDLTSLKEKEKELDVRIEQLKARKGQLLQAINRAKAVCESACDITESELQIQKSKHFFNVKTNLKQFAL